jgi:hypothetical protein
VHFKHCGKWVMEGLRYDGKCCCGRAEHVLSLTKSSRPTGMSSKEEGRLIYDMIYLLTEIRLLPGGSMHLHTNNT